MLESIVGKYRPLSKGFLHDRIALVYPRILLGPGGMSPTFIKTQNITHVLNCAEENACPPALSAHLGARGYACMDARDDETNILDSHYARFETAMDRFLRDPSCRNVYVHCQAGGRCKEAADILAKAGFDVRALKPGFPALEKAGFPTAKGK